MATAQLQLDFNASLLTQFPRFAQVLSAAVYGCGKPFKNIVADLAELTSKEYTASKLSRMLNEADEGINFPSQDLDALVAATGDRRPILWLVEKFLVDQSVRERALVEQVASALPALTAFVESYNAKNGGGS